jgi:hypothetical protein
MDVLLLRVRNLHSSIRTRRLDIINTKDCLSDTNLDHFIPPYLHAIEVIKSL